MLGVMIAGKRPSGMGLPVIFAVAALLAILIAAPAQATPLNLELLPPPDITFSNVEVIYDHTSETLTARQASSFASFDDGGVLSPDIIVNASFDITANIMQTGSIGNAFASTLTIMGHIGLPPAPAVLLLTGDLMAFGYPDPPDGGDIFEFVFSVTGGTLASDYGSLAGVKLTGNFGGDFEGTFASSFDNNGGGGTTNTAPVPEPATLLLLGSGLLGLTGLRRKYKK